MSPVAVEGVCFGFHDWGVDAEEEADGTLELAQPEDDEVDEHGVARRHRDTKLQTALPPQK